MEKDALKLFNTGEKTYYIRKNDFWRFFISFISLLMFPILYGRFHDEISVSLSFLVGLGVLIVVMGGISFVKSYNKLVVARIG